MQLVLGVNISNWIPLVTNIASSIWPNSWSYYFLIQKPYLLHALYLIWSNIMYLLFYILALTTYVLIYLSWFILHIISASCFVLDVPCWIILELQCNRKNKEELEKRECYKNWVMICIVLPWPCHNIAWL